MVKAIAGPNELIEATSDSGATALRRVAAGRNVVFAYVSLTKPRVTALVLFTAVSTAFAAAGGVPSWPSLVLLLSSGFLATGGAAALNHYFDRDIDSSMQRTIRRPLVTGEIRHPLIVLVTGTAMIVGGLMLAAFYNLMLATFVFAGAFVYVVVYTLWLKRRSPVNIVVGGLAGSSAVLGGWSAVATDLSITPVLLALLVLLWTPAHFWSLAIARSADYGHVHVPMLPVTAGTEAAAKWVLVHALLTVTLSLWLQPVASFGTLYLAVALVGGLTFLWLAAALVRRPDTAMAWSLFKFSGIYLGLLFITVMIESVLGTS